MRHSRVVEYFELLLQVYWFPKSRAIVILVFQCAKKRWLNPIPKV